MSPQPSRSPDRFSLTTLAEDHPTAPAQGDESESPPYAGAQRGEPNLHVVNCSSTHHDEEITVEEMLIPYVRGGSPDDIPGEPPKSRWWLSSGAAVTIRVAIVDVLMRVVLTPAKLNFDHSELPKTTQVSFVQLKKKTEPTLQLPVTAPEPTPPKIEGPKPGPPKPKPVEKPRPKPKPKPKPVEGAIPKVKSEPEPEPKPGPEPSMEASNRPGPFNAAPPPAPAVEQSTPDAQTAPSGSQSPAGLPSGSLNDSGIKSLRTDPLVYPRVAQAWGIEGRIKMLFTTTSDDHTDDIQVLESVPSCMSNREVRQVMARWRFESRVSGGKIVVRQVTKMFLFRIKKRR